MSCTLLSPRWQQHETLPEAPCAGGVKEVPAPGPGLVSEHLPSPFSSPTPQCPAVGSDRVVRAAELVHKAGALQELLGILVLPGSCIPLW